MKESYWVIIDLEARKVAFFFNDLRPRGTLADSVGKLTFFLNFDYNKTFLNIINYIKVYMPSVRLRESSCCVT